MNRAALVMATTVALFISVQTATAATRRVVDTGQTNQQIISTGSTIGTVSTPNGYAAFYGQDHVDEHTAGNRYQAGQSVPTTGGTSSTSSGTVKVKVKPVSMLNKAKTAAKAVSKLRSGPVGLASMAGTSALVWAIEQLPGASFDPATGEPVKAPEVLTSGYFWSARHYGGNTPKNALNPTDACSQLYISGMTAVKKDDWTYTCYRFTTQDVGSASRINFSCPNGLNTSTWQCHTTAAPSQPFTDTDYAALTSVLASVQNSDWLRDLVEKSCQGSTNPAGCYDELVDSQQLTGPASQTGQTVTTSETTSNPDGTTSTKTTSSTNTYTYTYGSNYYDYTITNNTSVNNNGQVTTTTTTDTTDPTQPETETPPEEEEKPTAPALGNPYSGVTDKYNQIKGEVESTSVNPPSISVSPWYSFTGQCSELTLELPVIGMWSTAYCPIIFNIVHPILTFLFILFTYHSCREYWDEAVRTARPI